MAEGYGEQILKGKCSQIRILHVILSDVDSFLRQYALDNDPTPICQYVSKINLEYNLKAISSTFNEFLNNLIFYNITSDGVPAGTLIESNQQLSFDMKKCAKSFLKLLNIDEKFSIELTLLSMECQEEYPFHPQLSILLCSYLEFVIVYYQTCELILSFDIDRVMIENLQKSIPIHSNSSSDPSIADKLPLVIAFFDLFRFGPIKLLKQKGLKTCFYDNLVHYEAKYHALIGLVQFYINGMPNADNKSTQSFQNLSSNDIGPLFQCTRSLNLWKSKVLMLMFNEQKSFIRILNLLAPISNFSFESFEFGLQLYQTWKERIKKSTPCSCHSDDFMCVRNPMDHFTSGLYSSLVMSIASFNFIKDEVVNTQLAHQINQFLKKFVMERDIYNIIRKELASLALFSTISCTELLQSNLDDVTMDTHYISTFENSICLGAFDATIHFLNTFQLYYSNKYIGEWMHIVVKCILSKFQSTVRKLWNLNFNEAHAELCFEYDRPFILSFLLMISTVYKHLHFSQHKFIDEFWTTPTSTFKNDINPLSEFIVNLAQYVNSGEVYGVCAKVLNRLCYNEPTAMHLSSLMENREVVYENATITNVFNIDIFIDIVKKLQGKQVSLTISSTMVQSDSFKSQNYSSQFLCTFDYFVVNSFLKLLCNLLSYNCQLFYDIVESANFVFLQDLIALYFNASSIKIQTKILMLFRLFSRHEKCAMTVFELLHEPSTQLRLYKSVKQNITVSLSGSYKFVAEIISLLRFWISWNARYDTSPLDHSRLFYEIYVLFLEQMFSSCELYNFKSELQQIQYVFECFGLIRDVLTYYQLKVPYLKTILISMSYFNASAMCDSKTVTDIGLPYTDACLYLLMFMMLNDSSVIRSFCYLFVYNIEMLDNINRQNEYFNYYCDIIRHCFHVFSYIFECESIISPVISESHLSLPPRKFSALLFSLADDKHLDVLHALINICCNKLLPDDIVCGALRFFFNPNIQNQPEIQSHLVSLYTSDEAQVSKLVVGFVFRIRDEISLIVDDPQSSQLSNIQTNGLAANLKNSHSTLSTVRSTTTTRLILELLFKMTLNPNKFTIAHVLLFGIKSSLEFFHLKNIYNVSIANSAKNKMLTVDLIGSENFFEKSHILKKLIYILQKIYNYRKQSKIYLPLEIEMMILRIFYINIKHPSYGLLLMKYLREYDFFYMPLPKMDYFHEVLETLKNCPSTFYLIEYMVLLVGFVRTDLDISIQENNCQRIISIIDYILSDNDAIILRLFEWIPIEELDRPQFDKSLKCFSSSDLEKLMSSLSRSSTLPEYYLRDYSTSKADVVYFDENNASQVLSTFVTTPKFSNFPSTSLHSDVCVILQWIVDTNQIQRLDFMRSTCLKSFVEVFDSVYDSIKYFDDSSCLLIVNKLQQLTSIILGKTRNIVFVSNSNVIATLSYCIFRVVKFVFSLIDMYTVDNLPNFYSCEHLEVLFGYCTSFLKSKATIVIDLQNNHSKVNIYVYATMLILIEIHLAVLSASYSINHLHGNDQCFKLKDDDIHVDDQVDYANSKIAKIYRRSLQSSLNKVSHFNCIGVVIHDAFNGVSMEANQTLAIAFLSKGFSLFKNNHIWLFNMSQCKFVEHIVNFVCEPSHKNYLRYNPATLCVLPEDSVNFYRLYQSVMYFLRCFSSTPIGIKYLCDSGLFLKFIQHFPHLDYQNRPSLKIFQNKPRFIFSNSPTLFNNLHLGTKTLVPFFRIIKNVITTDTCNVASMVPSVLDLFERYKESWIDILVESVSYGIFDQNSDSFNEYEWSKQQLAGDTIEILSDLAKFYLTNCKIYSHDNGASQTIPIGGSIFFNPKIEIILLQLLTCYSSSKMFQKICSLSNVEFGFSTNLNSLCWDSCDIGIASKIVEILRVENSILKYFCLLLTFDSNWSSDNQSTTLNRTLSACNSGTNILLLYPSLNAFDIVEIGRGISAMEAANLESLHFESKNMKVAIASNVGIGLLTYLLVQFSSAIKSIQNTIGELTLQIDCKNFSQLSSNIIIKILRSYGNLKDCRKVSEVQKTKLISKYLLNVVTVYRELVSLMTGSVSPTMSAAIRKLRIECKKLFDNNFVDDLLLSFKAVDNASNGFCEATLASIIKLIE